MRIHLGHHFYGAGNLGDDFMLAGFLAALGTLAPAATFTCCVPFPLEPLRARFPSVTWFGYDDHHRAACIAQSNVWLGLGGSPLQSAQSRWFIDHLVGDQATCQRLNKPMFYLGVGVQTTSELSLPDTQGLCAAATAIWTRDQASAERLASLPTRPPYLAAAADLAHLFFRSTPPPPPLPGRLTLVANFDYNSWSGQSACLNAVHSTAFVPQLRQPIWLAQESRDLPGAERALYASLPPAEQSRWQLVVPDLPSSTTPSLAEALARWPSGEYLITSRFHAAFAGAWAGSKIVVIGTNEKLRAAARELACPLIEPDAAEATVLQALRAAAPVPRERLLHLADQAYAACADFVRLATASSSAVAPDNETP